MSGAMTPQQAAFGRFYDGIAGHLKRGALDFKRLGDEFLFRGITLERIEAYGHTMDRIGRPYRDRRDFQTHSVTDTNKHCYDREHRDKYYGVWAPVILDLVAVGHLAAGHRTSGIALASTSVLLRGTRLARDWLGNRADARRLTDIIIKEAETGRVEGPSRQEVLYRATERQPFDPRKDRDYGFGFNKE